jgi:hypothetical protein
VLYLVTRESPWRAITVDRSLDRLKQGGFALDLLQRHGTRATHERRWISSRRIEDVEIIE